MGLSNSKQTQEKMGTISNIFEDGGSDKGCFDNPVSRGFSSIFFLALWTQNTND